ncbi:MAG: hypothetical protein R3C03_00955 [Pirellulaceae bacterium]
MFNEFLKNVSFFATAVAVTLAAAACNGQRAQFSDFYEVNPGTQPALIQGNLLPTTPMPGQIQQPGLLQPPPQIFSPGSNVLNGPVFDPYNANSQPLPALPGLSQPQSPIPNYTFNSPAPQVQHFGTDPQSNPLLLPQNFGNSYVFGNNPNGPNPYSNNSGAWPSQAWSTLRDKWWPRLIEHPRFRHLWISGENGNELGLNETELATTLTLPNFLGSSQPLLISPGFIFHFWDGPDTALTGFDMPAVTYSPYLALEASSDLRKQVGIETNVTLGVYSDFRNVNSDSLRIQGTGLAWYQVNSYTRFKVGVEYLDRIKVKMLPAFGFFMQPNNDMKVDLYFPRPRVAHRLPRFNDLDMWGYVGGEYGGGSWTIERIGNVDDQVDVNEVRAFVGLEWVGPRKVTGFLETGYVFDREILYLSDPMNRLSIQDAWMVRGGFSF